MGMDDDLSYLEALMGGAAEESGGGGGVWVVDPEGALDGGVLRLVGKARVLADGLGCYAYLLLAGRPDREQAQRAVHAGADHVLLASGNPGHEELAAFLRVRAPQVVLFPRTASGRRLGPALAHDLDASLCGYAADLVVDPVYQRLVAHQPILNDAARRTLAMLKPVAIAMVDTGLLPAAFSEPWRSGQVEEADVAWPETPEAPVIDAAVESGTLATAPVVVAVGRELGADGLELARRLAVTLGGTLAGDVGALDAGWITREQLVGLTGQAVAPDLYLALGVTGDTEHLMAVEQARTVVAVQPDETAPIVAYADWNIIADPAEFARTLLQKLDAA